MKSFFTSLALLCCLNSNAQTGVSDPLMVPFDNAMNNLLTQHNLPGAQLAITYFGRLVYSRGFGYADVANQLPVQPNSMFRIASISKPVTAIAIMKLYEQGLIGLDDKVFGPTGILNSPTYQNILDPQVNNITIRMLLQHTGGWNRDVSGDPMFNSYAIATAMGVIPPADPVTVIKYILANKMLDFTPGTEYHYSNFGYCVLGRVIEQIMTQDYDDYVKSTILSPAGISDMTLGFNLLANQVPNEVQYYDYTGAPLAFSVYNNSTLVPWPYGGFNLEAMDAHGGWIASAEDLCRLLVRVDRLPSKPDILLPATIDTMIKPCSVYNNYSCGFAVNQFNNWWHTGGLPGTATEIVRAGTQQMNWALLTNTRPQNDGPLYTAIDNLVWNTLSSITSWPTYDLFTGIDESVNGKLNIFPMPADNYFRIDYPQPLKENSMMKIYDLTGKEIRSQQITSTSIKINVTDIDEGLYIVALTSGENTVTAKCVIKHN